MKVLTVFGTRPEAIKMAPIVKELKTRPTMEVVVAVTGQHREMLDQVLKIFEIVPDYDLNIFKHGQTLTDITIGALKGLEPILEKEKPDILLIQGDTTTVFSGSLAAFYHQIPIGHVEAGLRSGNLYSPYPEEANRKLTGILTKYHFAPTKRNKEHLLREDYPEEDIYITGNTVIDALKYTVQENYEFEDKILNTLDYKNKKIILLTSHRRENLGDPMDRIFSVVRTIVEEYPEVEVVFPRHLNPKVREISDRHLKDHPRIHLIEPLDYLPFTNLMAKSYFVITDSGGIQEEAPSLGKPVLVVREETERPEGVEAGTAKLIGTQSEPLYKACKELLEDFEEYKKMAHAINPYGDGEAAKKIVDILEQSEKL
ncbi:MAG: UDP-N-acetylglucosamine 2-epimerase (non-hydrolyzing) [Tissierellia bacterium]|nr:UDP-N-acetylglucosamine 2-epimerase (non-hydrolyzing) [Tissierellia bacterium]